MMDPFKADFDDPDWERNRPTNLGDPDNPPHRCHGAIVSRPMKHRALLADSRFWQAATVAVPVSVVFAIFVFMILAGITDRLNPEWSSSLGVVIVIAGVVLLAIAVGLWWRRTPRCAGAALGVLAASVVVAYVALVTL